MACVPLSVPLEALGYSSVDLISLDTEGNEPDVLMTIPFHKVDVDVFVIECTGCAGPGGRDYKKKRDFLKTFFDANGYDELYFDVLDFVYRKRRKK